MMPSADWEDHAVCNKAVIAALETVDARCDERALAQDVYEEGGWSARWEIEKIAEIIREEIERLKGRVD